MGQKYTKERNLICRTLSSEEKLDMSPKTIENIEIYKKDENTFIVVIEKSKQIIALGCLNVKMTKKRRIGFIGVIKDIVVYDNNIKLREKLIQYMIVQAIEKGCYGYAMDEYTD